MNTLLVVTAALAVLVLVVGVVLLCWWVKDDAQPPQSYDPVINIDQWTEARRRRLADLQYPTAKFIEARRTRR